MNKICLVTNYNYARYLGECLASVAAQTLPFDLVLVVDDGSQDGSRQIIDAFCRDCSYARAIYKENGGQLSSFHAALPFIGPQDLVFFLDADDSYPGNYLEQLAPLISRSDAEFVFADPFRFAEGEEPRRSVAIGAEQGFLFASTSALTRKTLSWIGEATSCLCLRGSLLHELLPYPFPKDWVTRADDVLVFGASILGSHKLYLQGAGANYRLHGGNNFTGRELGAGERADWRLRHERLRRFYSEKAGLCERPPLKNALHEAALIPRKLRKRFGIPAPALLFFYDILLVVPMLRLLCRDLAAGRR